MAQDITDTAEEKGISYCIGYLAGPILVTKGAEKAIQGIKGLKASKAAKQAAGKVDDAAGYNDNFSRLIDKYQTEQDSS